MIAKGISGDRSSYSRPRANVLGQQPLRYIPLPRIFLPPSPSLSLLLSHLPFLLPPSHSFSSSFSVHSSLHLSNSPSLLLLLHYRPIFPTNSYSHSHNLFPPLLTFPDALFSSLFLSFPSFSFFIPPILTSLSLYLYSYPILLSISISLHRLTGGITLEGSCLGVYRSVSHLTTANTNTYIHNDIRIHIHIHINICIYDNMGASWWVVTIFSAVFHSRGKTETLTHHTHTHIHTHTCIHAHTHTHIHTHTHTHTHIHTHTLTLET